MYYNLLLSLLLFSSSLSSSLVVTFLPDINNYIPETNHVSRICGFAAILWLHFMVHVMLFTVINDLSYYINTVLSMYAVPKYVCFL